MKTNRKAVRCERASWPMVRHKIVAGLTGELAGDCVPVECFAWRDGLRFLCARLLDALLLLFRARFGHWLLFRAIVLVALSADSVPFDVLRSLTCCVFRIELYGALERLEGLSGSEETNLLNWLVVIFDLLRGWREKRDASTLPIVQDDASHDLDVRVATLSQLSHLQREGFEEVFVIIPWGSVLRQIVALQSVLVLHALEHLGNVMRRVLNLLCAHDAFQHLSRVRSEIACARRHDPRAIDQEDFLRQGDVLPDSRFSRNRRGL